MCEFAGKLLTLRGTVTRTSDVMPELREGVFRCGACGYLQPSVRQEFKFTMPMSCKNPSSCNNRRQWKLDEDKSTYDDWQKLRIQENANEIPSGSMPRSLNVILRGGLVDMCKAGDKLLVSGFLAVVPEVGSIMSLREAPKLITKEMRRAQASEMDAQNRVHIPEMGMTELSMRLVFIASHLSIVNSGDKDSGTGQSSTTDLFDLENEAEMNNAARGFDSPVFSDIERRNPILAKMFVDISKSPHCLDILAANFLPKVSSCYHIKRGLLCLLAGGVQKDVEEDNMKLRGDLNICIVGDPGTGKSSLLRQLHNFVPRSVLASGKMSTAAGLTASVVKDYETGGAPNIEAGALMLADKGICCIDEFDKMDGKDMSAIHEAMEQQTISISKAGVQATLNARASVVAVCAPINNKYDPSKPLRNNLRLTAPIISRFDLIFVLMDDRDQDHEICEHILKTYIGDSYSHPSSRGFSLSDSDLWEFIRVARTVKPRLTSAAGHRVSEFYTLMRQSDSVPGAQRHTRMTVRQLESMIRLSEAVAKLHLSEEVTAQHVEMAQSLFESSVSKLKYKALEFLDEQNINNDNGDEQKTTHMECIKIDRTEYDQCAITIIEHFNDQIILKKSKNDWTDLNIPFTDLCDMLLEKHFMTELATEADLEKLIYKSEKIVRNMIQVDQSLISTLHNEEELVRVNPNLISGAEAYGCQNNRGNTTENDVNMMVVNNNNIEDIDFMDGETENNQNKLEDHVDNFSLW